MKIKTILASSILVMFATTALAASDSAETVLLKKLQGIYPSTNFGDVHQSAIEGLFEVEMGKNIGYTNAEGRYFLFGHIFDMQTQHDLTQQRLDALNTVNFSELPLNDAIKTVQGDGSRILAIFSDPECPYCKRIEQELPKLKDVTIYTFLMPLEGLHPDAPKIAKSIWCASDRSTAWHDYMLNNKLPTEQSCENPIERNIQLGQKLNINGTPTLIAADGRVMPGAGSVEQIEKLLTGKGSK